MTKEEILAEHNIFGYMTEYGFAERAMQAYADQETASLQAELTRLKEENSMLLERINNGN